jgi:hypothetical protein
LKPLTWILALLGMMLAACSQSSLIISSTSTQFPSPLPHKPTITPLSTATFTPSPTLTPTIILTPTPTQTYTPSPTPFGGSNGGLIAYNFESLKDIFLSTVDGKNTTNLTQDLDDAKSFLSWSPNGEWIAFTRYKPEMGANGLVTGEAYEDTWVMKADGSEKHRLWGGEHVQNLNWAPDSSKVISGCPDVIGEICIVDLTNFQTQYTGQLTGEDNISPPPIYFPASEDYAWWGLSKTGKRVIFVLPKRSEKPIEVPIPFPYSPFFWPLSDRSFLIFGAKNEAAYLYHVNLDGAYEQLMAFPGRGSVDGISLSPDVSRLLISRYTHTSCCTIPAGYGVINIDGTGLVWLPGTQFNLIQWTLDGKYLIWQKYDDGSLYLINPTNGKVEKTDWLKWLQTSPPPNFWRIQPMSP